MCGYIQGICGRNESGQRLAQLFGGIGGKRRECQAETLSEIKGELYAPDSVRTAVPPDGGWAQR